MRIRESFMITPFKLNRFLFLCFAFVIIFYAKPVLSADSKKTDNKPAVAKAQSVAQVQTKADNNKKIETKPAAKMSQAMLTAAKAAIEAEKEQLRAKQVELEAAVTAQLKAKDALDADKARLSATQERFDRSLGNLQLSISSFNTLSNIFLFCCIIAIAGIGLGIYLFRKVGKAVERAVESLESARHNIEDMPRASTDLPEERPVVHHNGSEAEALLDKLRIFEGEINKYTEEFKDLSAKTPPSSEGKRRLAEYSKKLDILETFSSRKLSPKDYFNRGMEFYFGYKYLDGLNAFDKAIELKPDFSKAWQAKGLTLFRLGRQDEALRACDKVIVLYPNEPDSWYQKACILALMSRREEAFLNLKKALDRDKKYKAVARKDEDFKPYWIDPEFLDVVD